MTKETINVDNISCDACVRTIKNGLTQLKGINHVEVDKITKTVTVDYDQTTRQDIAQALDELGYPETKK